MEVKIVGRDGKAIVVEWVDNGKTYRGVLPAGRVRGNNAYLKDLRRAAPYGIAWEEVVELQATSELLAEELRKRGIWTGKDLYDHPEQAQSAIMATYGIDFQTLLKIASREA